MTEPHPATSPPSSPPTCKEALWSMIFGFIAIVLGSLGGIPAIILGHVGLSKVAKSRGALFGKGYAITGLILGYTFTLLSIIGLFVYFVVVPMLEEELRQKQDSAQHSVLEGTMASVVGKCELTLAISLKNETPFSCADVEDALPPSEEWEVELTSLGDENNDGSDDGCTITVRDLDTGLTLTETWSFQ